MGKFREEIVSLQFSEIFGTGLKTFLSFSEIDTEKSEFCSIEVLDETADSKATVLKTLNILHKKFQIGIKLQYQVVVGDRKSYDHLIKSKSEYGGSLSWVLPYPGDWPILFSSPDPKGHVRYCHHLASVR